MLNSEEQQQQGKTNSWIGKVHVEGCLFKKHAMATKTTGVAEKNLIKGIWNN